MYVLWRERVSLFIRTNSETPSTGPLIGPNPCLRLSTWNFELDLTFVSILGDFLHPLSLRQRLDSGTVARSSEQLQGWRRGEEGTEVTIQVYIKEPALMLGMLKGISSYYQYHYKSFVYFRTSRNRTWNITRFTLSNSSSPGSLETINRTLHVRLG